MLSAARFKAGLLATGVAVCTLAVSTPIWATSVANSGVANSSVAEASANGATQAVVTIDRKLPEQAWVSLCRNKLVQPQLQATREALAEQVGFSIAEPAGYFAGDIQGFKVQSHTDDEIRCSGTVVPGDSAANIAGTAVRAAWQMHPELTSEQLKGLLGLALRNPVSAADGVVLIAKLAAPEQQLSYLQSNLDAQALQLDDARAAAMQIYIAGHQYDTALALATQCDAVDCRRLIPAAQQGKRNYDAEQAKDLSNYF